MLQAKFLESFECLGDACEDTCCKGWGMQVDSQTVERYREQAPELLDAVTTGEAEHIMRRDPETDYCVKFDQGWCGIHRDRGTDFLGDACHFFPRVTRQLGDVSLQTASLSCPEVVRLVTSSEDPFAFSDIEASRVPNSLADYLPEGVSYGEALTTHRVFLDALDQEHLPAERFLARLQVTAQSLQVIDVASWPMAAGFYLGHADGRLQEVEFQAADQFNLLHALVGLIGASKKTNRPRLQRVLDAMTNALGVTFDAQGAIHLSEDSGAKLSQVLTEWESHEAGWRPFFRRWVQAQLSVACFPFAGFGYTLEDRATILAVRFATLKLAMMCWHAVHGVVNKEDAVLIVQSLARFLDHLADPSLSLAIYKETGWVKNSRLRALLCDIN